MSNKRLLLIAVLFLVAIAILFIFLRPQKRVNWRENYKQTSKDPYGASVLVELLDKRAGFGDFHVIRDSIAGTLPSEPDKPASYVFVGPAMFLTESGVSQLLAFAGNGGHVLVSSKVVPLTLMEQLYAATCDSIGWAYYYSFSDTLARLSLTHPSFRKIPFSVSFHTRNQIEYYAWNYIGGDYFCETSEWAHLGYVNDTLVNFVRIPYDEGFVYLHTTPLAFSNYHLRSREGWQYASNVFSHLPDGPVYWDESSKVPELTTQMPDSSTLLSRRGPLQYIMSQPSLTWAWYLLLLSALLFLLFRGKRRQRIIPVLAQNKNTSLDFVNIMGRLYFLQNNHRKLALQMLKLFFMHVRERYNLQSRDIDDIFVERLKARSEVKPEVIDKIVLLNRNITNSQYMSANTLIDLNKHIDFFYKNCK